jgi:hypothetical protein
MTCCITSIKETNQEHCESHTCSFSAIKKKHAHRYNTGIGREEREGILGTVDSFLSKHREAP